MYIVISIIIIVALLIRHRKLFYSELELNHKLSKIYDGTQEIIMINKYETAKQFYVSKTERTYKYLGYTFNKLLKFSIGAHSGNDWLMMKKPLSKFFNSESVRNHFDIISDRADMWLNQFDNKLKESKYTDGMTLQGLGLDKLTIAILSNIIYGDLNEEQLNELYELSLLHNKMMTIMGSDMCLRCPIARLFPSKNKTQVNNFWNRWSKFNDNIRNEKKHLSESSNTLFDIMLESDVYSNDKLKFYQTLYEVMLFNLDIMIDSFANLVWCVSTNAECQKLIFDEINTINTDSFDGINCLEYTDNVINESARLNPGIVVTFAETLLSNADIGNIILKKGTKISLNTGRINRDPMIWNHPDMFDPARFTTQNKHQFHRFGLGPRKCLGNVYANYILKIGLTKLIREYTLHQDKELIKEKRTTIVNLSNYDMANKIIFKKRNF